MSACASCQQLRAQGFDALRSGNISKLLEVAKKAIKLNVAPPPVVKKRK